MEEMEYSAHELTTNVEVELTLAEILTIRTQVGSALRRKKKDLAQCKEKRKPQYLIDAVAARVVNMGNILQKIDKELDNNGF